jgi:hypothetical protein
MKLHSQIVSSCLRSAFAVSRALPRGAWQRPPSAKGPGAVGA